MSTWHDLASARAEWSDVKQLNDDSLQDLLDLAKDACWYFDHDDIDSEGAELLPPNDVPVRYRVAQLLHARAIWQLPRGGSDGSIGADGYTTRVYVLGYDIQKILRPPVFGELVS